MQAERRIPLPTQRTEVSYAVPAARTTNWGWLPLLSLVAGSGLALVEVANRLSYLQVDWAEAVFWTGFLVLLLPVALRLASIVPSREERIGLVLLLGMSFYFIKLLHSPFAFTFSDERLHLFNANAILESGHLFRENSILPVSPLYPGVELVTTALSKIAGLSVFDSGRIIIGAARLVIVSALYLLYEQLTGSPRVAGLASLLYMANSNFLFWSAQFSYESLALPIAVMVVYAVVRQSGTEDASTRWGLMLTALLAITAVVITHHVTSYLLMGYLWSVSVVGLFVVRGKKRAPWLLAVYTLAGALLWLLYVSGAGVDYLYGIFSRALDSVSALMTGQQVGRGLFISGSGSVAPLWERLVGFGSVIVIFLGLPFGLFQIWRCYRSNPTTLLLSAAAMSYLGVLGLRLVPAAWEIANRASEFLYLGLGLVLALAWLHLADAKRANILTRGILAVCMVFVFMGGIIAGWPANLRLSLPYQVAVGETTIEPQGASAAEWARSNLGHGNRMAADLTNGLFMLANGDQYVYSGQARGVQDLIRASTFGRTGAYIVNMLNLRYIVVDRRLSSADAMLGLYIDPKRVAGDAGTAGAAQLTPEAMRKFDDLQNVNRLLDTGDIVLYDVSGINEDTTGK